MRNSEEFAKLLIGMDKEICFTNIRLHGGMYTQFLDEVNDSVKLHFSKQISNRDKEWAQMIIEECKSRIRSSILACGEILPNKVEVILTGSDLVRIDEALDSILGEVYQNN